MMPMEMGMLKCYDSASEVLSSSLYTSGGTTALDSIVIYFMHRVTISFLRKH